MKRPTWIALGGMVSAILSVALTSANCLAQERTTRAVIELFTSQGCSSCPPADALMEKLATDPTLIVLSFPVDYWDYLGWKDTLAKAEYSARQRDYAYGRGDRDVYTPQVVIDGRDHAIGSDADTIKASIQSQLTAGALPIRVGVNLVGDTVVAHLSGAAANSDAKATVWLVKYGQRETITIGRGENSGRTVTYTNVVKEMQPVGVWKGQAMTVELPRNVITNGKNCGFALLLQIDNNGKPGPIIGATILDESKPS